MYELCGSISSPRDLARLVPRLAPVGERGSGCTITHRIETRDLFQPLLQEVLPGPWRIAFIVVVPTNCLLPLHRDDMKNPIRYVVVLQTNPDCWCFHDGAWQHLEEGNVYKMDSTLPHAAINFGGVPRIHLSVDLMEE